MAKEVKAKPKENKTLNLLLENSIALQNTLTNLAGNLKILNAKISSLLSLFESASRTIREKPSAASSTELLDKFETLAKQNKTIAKGLLLLERAIREKEKAPVTSAGTSISTSVRPLPEL